MSRRPGNSFMQLWGAPLLLSVLTLIGLVSALTGDGGLHYWVSVSYTHLTLPTICSV